MVCHIFCFDQMLLISSAIDSTSLIEQEKRPYHFGKGRFSIIKIRRAEMSDQIENLAPGEEAGSQRSGFLPEFGDGDLGVSVD